MNVCHPKRIYRNKVFKGLAKRGKSTKGWFFGFKLHIDAKGNLINAKLTKGNANDRSIVPQMTANMKGSCGQRLHQQRFVSSFDGSGIENNHGDKTHHEKYFDVVRGENSSAQTLSRRDGFRQPQKQIHARAFQT
ncbi:MAG: transposase [Alphaproteobacteria bacterium]|nr:transposase [Alphaproteobacteria bacterium]